ncbi:hypothetical protein NLU13_9397 [Sarocladium strictum]|uniref:Uncharacterized protein n=1 Tax=Sarocladium strictum TaxID=5046 RepID=A0AA39GAI0_SARSR|nr:hypothetical protein NLU13_9397 [Sarocladium strictum]
MPPLVDNKSDEVLVEAEAGSSKPREKLGMVSGVYIPVFLNIISILMFLRFGVILGQVGFVGMFGLLLLAYLVNLLTALSLSAIASNGEVKGGGAYYLISRSLGPEFGGSIGILFYLAQVLNTSLNIVGLIDCIRAFVGVSFPKGYWTGYALQTGALVACTGMSLLGSATFSKASNALLAVLSLAIISIPISAIFKAPFEDEITGVTFTGPSLTTLAGNFLPHTSSPKFEGIGTFRTFFGILFPATSGIFAGASMSGDLREPSRMIPKGTLWAMLTTFIVYFVIIFSMALSTTHASFVANPDVIPLTNLSAPLILAGECAVSVFSSLMGIIGAAKLFQALSRDKLLPGLLVFANGTKRADEPIAAIFLTYAIAQAALLADLNQIATLISMGYQMTFFVMNLACFLLKIGSAPNFRPSFKFFSWQTAFLGSLMSAFAMFFIEVTYAATAICALILVFLLIHYLCPPKKWGDVSQNLIYHQVRKYLLRLKPEHIKFWRPHIILLVNNPRRQTRLIKFCNSMKKGSLYILGHVIVTDDFDTGVEEAKMQQHAWTNYISEASKIKAFVQLTMSPSFNWGIRNLILSAGLGGMRPNIAVVGFYNMDDLRLSGYSVRIPDVPCTPTTTMRKPPTRKASDKAPTRRRGDTSARLLAGSLPTDVIRTEGMLSPTEYMTMMEDLTLKHRMNVAVGYGFESLETPQDDGTNTKRYIDLWPIQMSAAVNADGKNFVTTNFDTYTLILQLGHILSSVQAWRRAYNLRVMVFVEYENEIDEEMAQVRALLEKLRIDAEVKVFWLAAGQLQSYELIINGRCSDIDWEIIVNEALRDEYWWEELQALRGKEEAMTSSQEMNQLVNIIDSTSGRPGVFNPHEDFSDFRRSSASDASELPKKPATALLAKMGVSMGIHTQHLGDDVFHEVSSESESELGITDDEDMESPLTRTVSDQIGEGVESTRQPLLAGILRRRSRRLSSFSRGPLDDNDRETTQIYRPQGATYGTMGTPSRPHTHDKTRSMGLHGDSSQEVPVITEQLASPGSVPTSTDTVRPSRVDSFPSLDPEDTDAVSSSMMAQSSFNVGSMTQLGQDLPEDIPSPVRPNMSRQTSGVRFSSRPVPGTQIVDEGDASKIRFAATPTLERPSFSRQSSVGRFSSRPVPETRMTGDGDNPRTITFAETPIQQASAAHSRHHSRQGSQYSNFGQADASLDISSLLESYRFDQEQQHLETADAGGGSPYSTQGLALSFNDLPSRAQHLILNELMRRNSADTAVLMTTLPVPSEGTCLDDAAAIQYLSDIEVLCNELPPVLMVLSNSMTVTVNL